MPAPLLSARSLTKDYQSLRALDAVDFDLRAGEVHVLFGENGAGKSTLISILAGAIVPTSGYVEMKGEELNLASVHDARKLGISAVFQEFSLIPQMTVEENLFLGAEHTRHTILDKGSMHREALELLGEFGFELRPNQRVDRLSRAEQQMVEIAKAFRDELTVLILDEPTASLTQHETELLFVLIRELIARGVGIVYITHRIGEIRQIGDRITVLRDGRHVATLPVADADDDALVRLMTGREIGAIFPTIIPRPTGDDLLTLDNVTTAQGQVLDVSMSVSRGEIVGLAGLMGSGKSEAMQAAFGALHIAHGRVIFNGEDVTGQSPVQAIRRGFLYLPADRKHDGLMMMRPARENMSLSALDDAAFRRWVFLDRSAERRRVAELARQLNLSPNRPERNVELFSGGNQQKTMLARSLTRNFKFVVFDEPTVGVDVGTRAVIYRFIVELAEAGKTVIIVSSELPEILHLSMRAYVFHHGRVQAELSRDELSEESVLAHFFERNAA